MDAFEDFEGFDCSICLERLDETCKALPCQHTFCKSCLKSIVASKQELRCPECRRLVTEDVEDLPGNIMLIRLLEGLKNRRTKKNLETTFVRPGVCKVYHSCKIISLNCELLLCMCDWSVTRLWFIHYILRLCLWIAKIEEFLLIINLFGWVALY